MKSNPCWWAGCRGSNVHRATKPQIRSTTELAKINGDKAQPQPNTRATHVPQPAKPQVRPRIAPRITRQPYPDNTVISSIPQLDSNIPTPRYAPPNRRSNNNLSNLYPDIPQLEPVTIRPEQQYEPILVALNHPTREQYVFGNKAVANYARNARNPLSNASTYQLRRIVSGNIRDARDLAAIWQSSWDEQNFHLRIAVRDDVFSRDSRNNWEDDSIEVFIDADASKGQQYDRYNDFHLLYRWRDKRLVLGTNSQPIGVAHKSQHVNGHYVLDLTIPWTVMRVRPRIGHRIGLDVHVNDDDNGGGREGKLTWFGKVDEAYRNPSVLGELVLR